VTAGWGEDATAVDVIKEAVKTLAVNLDAAASTPCEVDVTVAELDA
jgi:hypothetical protein